MRRFLIITFILVYSPLIWAERSLLSASEGLVIVRGSSAHFGVLSELQGNPREEVSQTFQPFTSKSGSDANRLRALIMGIDRVAAVHPILGDQLISLHEQDLIVFKAAGDLLTQVQLEVPDQYKGREDLYRAFKWITIHEGNSIYHYEQSIMDKLSDLDWAKVRLYTYLENLGYSTTTKLLEDYINFIYSPKYESSSVDQAVALSERSLNLDMNRLGDSVQEQLSENWINHSSKPVEYGEDVHCLTSIDPPFSESSTYPTSYTLVDDKGRQVGKLIAKDHELSYLLHILSQVHQDVTTLAYRKLYGGPDTDLLGAPSLDVCYSMDDSTKAKIKGLIFGFSGKVGDLKEVLKRVKEEYQRRRRALEGKISQHEYDDMNALYRKTGEPEARQVLADKLNTLNIHILGVASGIEGDVVQMDSDALTRVIGDREEYTFQLRFGFQNDSGPFLEMIPPDEPITPSLTPISPKF